jgi:N-acetylmuramic acid 6-phosphate etherase
MVDLRPRSAKLRARALRLVQEIGRAREREAARLLLAAGGSVKLAIVMARLHISARQARQKLKEASGSLSRLLG